MINEYYKHVMWLQKISILYFGRQQTMFSKQPFRPHGKQLILK